MPTTPNKNLPYPAPGDPADVPTDMGELALAIDALPAPVGAWQTGDTKVSAKTATHADPQGGTWHLADGSASPASLIPLLGANLPDARGRGLVMLGTHADVNALGKSDGNAVGSRRPKHRHTVALAEGTGMAVDNSNSDTNTTDAGSGFGWIGNPIRVGPQTGAEPIDSEAYVVVGNLFYHS